MPQQTINNSEGGGSVRGKLNTMFGEIYAFTKTTFGLGNVDNTSDVNKPVSTAQQTALDLKAPLASPALTGTPTAPTAVGATNNTQIATTAFVQALIANIINSAPGALDQLNELAAALGNDANFAATMTTALAGKQPIDATLTALAGLASGADKLPYFTGTDVLAQADLTSFGRSVIAAVNAAALRTILNVADGATAYSDENARDVIGAALVAGTNITITVNDAGDTITIDAAGGGGSDPWTWQKLGADVSNSTVTLAAATGLSFTATANETYLIEVRGAFQAAASTTGLAVAVDIPSGSVIGQMMHSSSATGLNATEQIADAATTGASTGVRASNTNVPFTAWFVVAVGVTGGTIELQFRSEIAASAVTLKANLTAMGRRII